MKDENVWCHFLPFTCSHTGRGSALERKLQAAEEKLQQLAEDKSQLEKNMSGMMKASGDNSFQLTKMNEDLMKKERYQRSLSSLLPIPNIWVSGQNVTLFKTNNCSYHHLGSWRSYRVD